MKIESLDATLPEMESELGHELKDIVAVLRSLGAGDTPVREAVLTRIGLTMRADPYCSSEFWEATPPSQEPPQS